MMKNLLEQDIDSFRLEEKLKAVEEFEKELIREGKIPNIDELLLRKYKIHLQYTGGVLLAFSISVVSILFNFIFFNMIIHL
jgi:hypothetical protein